MAVESVTIGTIATRVRFHLANTATAITLLDSEIKMAISWAIRDLVCKTNHPAYRAETTVSVGVSSGLGSSSRDFLLNAGVERIIEPGVRFDAAPYTVLRYYEQQDYDDSEGAATMSTSGRPDGYTLRGRDATTGQWVLRLNRATDATYSLRYSYLGIPTNHTASADGDELDPRFPRAHWDAIVFGALTMFPQYLESDQIQVYSSKYVELAKMMADRASPVVGNVSQAGLYGTPGYGRGRAVWPSLLYSGAPPW